MTGRLVVGVDPGGSRTGLCVCAGQRPVTFEVVERRGRLTAATVADEDYQSDVLAGLVRVVEDALDQGYGPRLVVAVEGIRPPNPHMNRGGGGRGDAVISMAGPLGSAVVLGTVQGWALTSGVPRVVVPPGKHGAAPLAWYRQVAPALVGARERSGSGRLSHARSAYDVAQAAGGLARVDAATRRGRR